MKRLILGVGLLLIGTFFTADVWAAKSSISVSSLPMRYAFVEGDTQKFRELTWMKEGYVGGVEDVSIKVEEIPGDISAEAAGRALIDDNDLAGSFRIEKEDTWYVFFDYREFSRFYDNTGGVYYPFTQLSAVSLDRELELEIGRIRVEAGLSLDGLPDIVLYYERKFKDGSKSRLTWGPAREGSVARNIIPSFQDIDQIVDIFGIKASKEVAGFELKGEQRWELLHADLMREEINRSTSSTASRNKIRQQYQNLESDVMTTTGSVGRWYQDGKAFTGVAYRYLRVDNEEVENIFELNQNRVITNFSRAKQIRDARADTNYSGHTWVGTVLVTPLKWLNITGKLKAEAIRSEGNSEYPSDTSPAIPDGIINRTEKSETKNRILRWGESVSLRFTAIPKTVIYADGELEQVKNWLSEDRKSIGGQSSPSANEIFGRETITEINRGIFTVGARITPWHFLDWTLRFRHRRANNDFDDKRETDPRGSTARSAFFDALNIRTSEVSTRMTLKFWNRVKPSFRYQMRTDDYMSRVEDQNTVNADMESHVYSADLLIQPVDSVLLTTTLSRQHAWTATPASSSSVIDIPRFNADVTSWMINGEYLARDNLSFNGGFYYSVANNFNDFTATGLPLGADYDELDIHAGATWSPHQNVTLECRYSFYRYMTSSIADSGNFDAHILWAEATIGFG